MNDARVPQGMKERLEQLKTLRDEIRVDLHLAGMDLKDRWRELEPKVLEAERRAEEVGFRVLDELVEGLIAVRETMRERKGGGPSPSCLNHPLPAHGPMPVGCNPGAHGLPSSSIAAVVSVVTPVRGVRSRSGA